MSDAIVVQNIAKRFDTVQAVAGISFAVRPGELFGLLGPNGAGKTTTINMLTGLARPDCGTICIGGVDCSADPRAAQHLVGVVPDESNLYAELSGFDNLCFCAALYGIGRREREARARRLLDTFGLAKAAGRRFGGYSKGMKRKLTIAAGIIHRPPILFLDEPTTGIDVASARQLRQLIVDLHRSGTTILLTTHYIEEAERLCGRIAFLVDGRIVRIDTVADLLQPLRGTHRIRIATTDLGENVCTGLQDAFASLAFAFPEPGRIEVGAADPLPVGPLVRFIEDQGAQVFEARRIQPSLEEVFVTITGIETDAMRREKEKKGGGQ